MSVKPLLLLPAGSPEALAAALEGGADAVYLGFSRFNARGRAKNFQLNQLPALLRMTHEHNARLYLTLNSLIKNSELPGIIEYLLVINAYPPDAVIIQDWGVYHLINKYFTKLSIHASTQMGNHNSLDCRYAKSLGFSRVILARELSLEELKTLKQRADIELEIFAHGALCYSLSGSCLFSSWAGGMSANRGQCRQPCRHQFSGASGLNRYFSMKDLELIDYLPRLIKLGISAIKIEGRMRSPDYVYQVARAYRLAIDHPEQLTEAKSILLKDGGREKTTWFFSGASHDATTSNSYTGLIIGKVLKSTPSSLEVLLTGTLRNGQQIRVQTALDFDAESQTISNLVLINEEQTIAVSEAHSGDRVSFSHSLSGIEPGAIVYGIPNSAAKRWSVRLPNSPLNLPDKAGIQKLLSAIQMKAHTNPSHNKTALYFRITDRNWLPMLKVWQPAAVFLPAREDIPSNNELFMIPELPYFTPEADLPNLEKLIAVLTSKGFKTFLISRLSQTALFGNTSAGKLWTNEQVYALNDAAISFLQDKGIKNWILPLENDYPNLTNSHNRNGIVPLYYHPALFVSRQILPLPAPSLLKHGKDSFRLQISGSEVTVFPIKAVCNFTFRTRLQDKGYHRFLIDLSQCNPSQDFLDNLMQFYNSCANLPDTSRFNMKQGLW